MIKFHEAPLAPMGGVSPLQNTGLIMEMKVTYIFQALKDSGVSITDFSRLTRVSRETLYRWKKGSPIVDRLRLDLAYSVAIRLEKACRIKKLPLKNRLKKDQRLALLRKIVAAMSNK